MENVFENIELLEPKCPACKSKIVLGVSTSFSQKAKCHVCQCGERLL